MKRFLFFWAACLSVLTVAAQARPAGVYTVQKQTALYAVKGADSLYLDRYCNPELHGERPCVMFVFGGGFVGGGRDHNKAYRSYYHWLVGQGYDVVAIDYRLGLKGVSTTQGQKMGIKDKIGILKHAVDIAVEDLMSATAYVLDRRDWEIDRRRVVATGSSAGAIAVLQAENHIANHTQTAQKLLPDGFNYAGIISYAGAIFSTTGAPEWKSMPCPIMLFHGSSDANVPYDKVALLGIGFYGSKTIFTQLQKLNAPYYFHDEEYATHTLAVSPMVDNRCEIQDFLQRFVSDGQRLQIYEHLRLLSRPKGKTKFGIGDYLRSNYKF